MDSLDLMVRVLFFGQIRGGLWELLKIKMASIKNAVKCREMQRNAEKCREMQRNAEKCREMLRNAEKCSEM